MQTEATNLKSNRGGARIGAGRRPGYKSPSTVSKIAIKILEQVMQDETAPPEARVTAACKLIDEAKA